MGFVEIDTEGEPWTDAELTELALAADPDQPLDPHAVAYVAPSGNSPALLPSWYMPLPTTVGWGGWRRTAVFAIVATLLVLEGLGLCSIFGQVVIG